MYTEKALLGAFTLGLVFMNDEDDPALDAMVELLLCEEIPQLFATALTDSGHKVDKSSVRKLLKARKVQRMMKELQAATP